MAANASEELRAIAVRLRAAGEGSMWRRVAAALRKGASPLVPAVEAEAAKRLPQSGGLAKLVADRHTTISVRTGISTAGVRLIRRKDSAGRQLNSGHVYHKTFGIDPKVIPWKRQETPGAKGWWTEPLVEKSPAITPALEAVMREVADEIQGRGI